MKNIYQAPDGNWSACATLPDGTEIDIGIYETVKDAEMSQSTFLELLPDHASPAGRTWIENKAELYRRQAARLLYERHMSNHIPF